MEEMHVIIEQLLLANKELDNARSVFFERASQRAYEEYLRCLKKVNKLEERLGCCSEDLHRMFK